MSGNPRHPSIPSRPFNPREVKKGEAPPHRVEAVTSPTKINPFQQSCKTPRSPNKDLRSSDDKNLFTPLRHRDSGFPDLSFDGDSFKRYRITPSQLNTSSSEEEERDSTTLDQSLPKSSKQLVTIKEVEVGVEVLKEPLVTEGYIVEHPKDQREETRAGGESVGVAVRDFEGTEPTKDIEVNQPVRDGEGAQAVGEDDSTGTVKERTGPGSEIEQVGSVTEAEDTGNLLDTQIGHRGYNEGGRNEQNVRKELREVEQDSPDEESEDSSNSSASEEIEMARVKSKLEQN